MQSSLPTGLQNIPSYSLHYGTRTRKSWFSNLIQLDDFHFSKGIPVETLWDLYFLELFQHDCRLKARLILVPRGVYDCDGQVHFQAVHVIGWTYLGALDCSRLQWGLSILLEGFFGTKILPHCCIETFLVSLHHHQDVKPNTRESQSVRKTEKTYAEPRTHQQDKENCTDCNRQQNQNYKNSSCVNERLAQKGRTPEQPTQMEYVTYDTENTMTSKIHSRARRNKKNRCRKDPATSRKSKTKTAVLVDASNRCRKR